MKKIFCVILLLFVATSFLAAKDSGISLYWDIGTSAISYGKPEIKALHKNLIDKYYTRLVLSGDLGFSIELDPRIHFLCGYSACVDSFIRQSESLLHLDNGGFFGLKLAPFDSGFNFGVEYNTGIRIDFHKLPSIYKTQTESTKWGNGFRFSIEYDFSYHTNGFAPVIGISWRNQPRGGYSDNLSSIFVRTTF